MMENQSGVAAVLLFLVVSVLAAARVHFSDRPAVACIITW